MSRVEVEKIGSNILRINPSSKGVTVELTGDDFTVVYNEDDLEESFQWIGLLRTDNGNRTDTQQYWVGPMAPESYCDTGGNPYDFNTLKTIFDDVKAASLGITLPIETTDVNTLEPRLSSLESGLSSVEGKQIKALWYETITVDNNSDGATGTIAPPSGGTISEWAAGFRGVVNPIANGIPKDDSIRDTDSATIVEWVTVALDANGDYTISGALSAADDPVQAAIVYPYTIPLSLYNPAFDLNSVPEFEEPPEDLVDRHIVKVDPYRNSDQYSVWYRSINDAVDYASSIATAQRPVTVLLTVSLTITQPITLTNPYVDIRGIGSYSQVITVDDSLAGQSIFTINYSTSQTNSPFGQLRIEGSPTLKSTASTVALDIIGQGVMYINTLRISNFNTGVRLDRLIGFFQVVLFEDNLTVRDCTEGIYIDTSSVIIAKLNGVDNDVNINVQTNGNLTIENGSMSGFMNSQTDTGISTTGSPSIRLNTVEFSNLLIGIIMDDVNIDLNGTRFDDTPGDEVLSHVIVNGNPDITVTGVKFDTSKIDFNNFLASFNGNFINLKEDDRSFWVLNKFNVGLPNAPKLSSLGGGGTYNLAALYFDFDGTTFSDAKPGLFTAGDLSFWQFPNNNTGTALYVSNTYGIPFLGLQTTVTAPAVLGGGDIVFEYWDGVSWQEFNYMVARDKGTYEPFGMDKFQQTGGLQFRFDERITEDWQVNDPILSGTPRYWIRIRISSAITTSPILDIMKLHTNSAELNEDGFIEFYGTSRPLGPLPIAYGSFQAGTSSPANQDIFISDGLFAGRIENSFQNGTTDRTGLGIGVPLNTDTSCPVRLHVTFSGESGVLGDVLFEVRWGWINVGDLIYRSTGAAPALGPNEQQIQTIYTYPESETDVVQSEKFELEIPDLIPQKTNDMQGDVLFITIGRIGGDALDTYSGDINIISVEFYYTLCRLGGHINAEL